ncbi:MIP/aquaporin family protein [Endomicrobium proavitum]|uniref:Aquaporin n=1 Tax=Endomicrobium proavitum TaxID=1408281 RepID=A0A0G3WIX1_9BACT|nr:aquaporin [Endomicrobium proavitum]AKL98596.1 Aquaporin [Endomicrobium proavitum]
MKKAYWAELIGTLFLVLMGCGSAVVGGQIISGNVGQVFAVLFNGNQNAAVLGTAFTVFGNLSVAFAFGLTIVAMIYALGPVSGGHFNPAVTIGAWISKRINTKEAGFYILFQVIGGIVGAFLLYLITSNIFALKVTALGQNFYNAQIWWIPFIVEAIFTALFVLVVLGSTSSKANVKFAGLAIGLTLVLVHIVAIPITGTSVNPARSFGPAIFSALGGNVLALKQVWLFILAPVVGAIGGAYAWKLVSDEKK